MDKAIHCYKTALELDPKHAFTHNNLGCAYLIKGEVDRAIDQFQKAIRFNPTYTFAYNNLGMAHKLKRQTDKAVECFEKAISIDVKYALAYHNLGATLNRQRKYAEAETAFRKYIQKAPESAKGYYGLGISLVRQKKRDDAIQAYRKSIKLQPTYIAAYSALGGLLHGQRHHEEAIALIREGVKRNANRSLSVSDRARLKVLKGRLSFALRRRAAALQKQGKLDDAIKDLRESVRLRPELQYGYVKLGSALAKLKHFGEAIDTYRKYLELNANSTVVLDKLIWLLLTVPDSKLRNTNEAVALARRAVKVNAKIWPCWNTLSLTLYRVGDWKGALEARRQALKLSKGDMESCWNQLGLALLQWRMDQKTDARRSYDQAVKCLRKLKSPPKRLRNLHNEAGVLLNIEPPEQQPKPKLKG